MIDIRGVFAPRVGDSRVFQDQIDVETTAMT
jgi:hypothetical protein